MFTKIKTENLFVNGIVQTKVKFDVRFVFIFGTRITNSFSITF